MVVARPLIVREYPGDMQPATFSGCLMPWNGAKILRFCRSTAGLCAEGLQLRPPNLIFFMFRFGVYADPGRWRGASAYAICKVRLLGLVHCGSAMALCTCNSTRWVPIPRDPLPPTGGLEEDKYIILSIFFNI